MKMSILGAPFEVAFGAPMPVGGISSLAATSESDQTTPTPLTEAGFCALVDGFYGLCSKSHTRHDLVLRKPESFHDDRQLRRRIASLLLGLFAAKPGDQTIACLTALGGHGLILKSTWRKFGRCIGIEESREEIDATKDANLARELWLRFARMWAPMLEFAPLDLPLDDQAMNSVISSTSSITKATPVDPKQLTALSSGLCSVWLAAEMADAPGESTAPFTKSQSLLATTKMLVTLASSRMGYRLLTQIERMLGVAPWTDMYVAIVPTAVFTDKDGASPQMYIHHGLFGAGSQRATVILELHSWQGTSDNSRIGLSAELALKAGGASSPPATVGNLLEAANLGSGAGLARAPLWLSLAHELCHVSNRVLSRRAGDPNVGGALVPIPIPQVFPIALPPSMAPGDLLTRYAFLGLYQSRRNWSKEMMSQALDLDVSDNKVDWDIEKLVLAFISGRTEGDIQGYFAAARAAISASTSGSPAERAETILNIDACREAVLAIRGFMNGLQASWNPVSQARLARLRLAGLESLLHLVAGRTARRDIFEIAVGPWGTLSKEQVSAKLLAASILWFGAAVDELYVCSANPQLPNTIPIDALAAGPNTPFPFMSERMFRVSLGDSQYFSGHRVQFVPLKDQKGKALPKGRTGGGWNQRYHAITSTSDEVPSLATILAAPFKLKKGG